jgi:hypothetical protein
LRCKSYKTPAILLLFSQSCDAPTRPISALRSPHCHYTTMFSPLKITLFAIVSFATLTFAIPSPEAPRTVNPMTLIRDTNVRLEKTLVSLRMCCLPTPHATHANRIYTDYLTPSNATSDCFVPIIGEVVEIVGELVSALQGSNISGCDCTSNDILVLFAAMLKVLVISLSGIFLLRSYSPTIDHPQSPARCIRFKYGHNLPSR